jgi:hypothetical protein
MIRHWVGALAIFALLSAPAVAADFEAAASDIKGVVTKAKDAAKKDKTEVKPIQAKYRSDRDCVHFRFKPEGPEVSDAVWLRSTEYREECHWQGDPRRGGGGRVCHEVPAWTHRERVQLSLEGRQKLFPWEDEVFEVCLDGRWLSAYAVRVSHKYEANRQGGDYTMVAKQRIPGIHDKFGLSARVLYPAGGVKAVFHDKWASYYPGEKVFVKAKLRREINNWPDSTLGEKEFTFDTADSYEIDFSEFAKKLKGGKKYYVEYGFKRIGKVSKEKYIKTGDSPSFVYRESLAPMVFAY